MLELFINRLSTLTLVVSLFHVFSNTSVLFDCTLHFADVI
uniref:Uncharacterized protein n=1 Tax=Moniliophthora roreri TaxID=221103 RepID=A0A0W0FI07_MONRR